MTSITFLGTGGGRFTTLSQRRYTGGLWLESEETNISIDPGPGALIRAIQFEKPLKTLDAVIVTHNHLEHYNDAELMIEGMTDHMSKNKGTLITNLETLSYISRYHQSMIDLEIVNAGDIGEIDSLKLEFLPTVKHDNAFGVRFTAPDGVITYTSDTGYSKNLAKSYRNSDILILNVLRPTEFRIEKHLCTEDAIKIINDAKPKKAVLTHFGLPMLNANPYRIANEITAETGIMTIAAKDGLSLSLLGEGSQQTLTNF